jgi:hypothetical protein
MSRHPWYTASGLTSRIVFNAAVSIDSVKIPCAVLYGLIEVFGLGGTIKALIALRKQGRNNNA